MKTTDINKSDKKETINALVFIAVLFSLLLLAGKVFAGGASVAGKPAGLESFTADCNNYYALIKWETSNDDENSSYMVERTQDGVHFETVAEVKPAGGNALHRYSVIDESPINGISYYTISQVTKGGEIVCLNTVVYTPCENDEVIKASNSANTIFIQVNAKNPDTCCIVLKDANGNIVLKQNHKISTGLNDFNLVPDVENGVYVLSIRYKKYKFNKVFILGQSGK